MNDTPKKPKGPPRPPLAGVHAHFYITRTETADGPITLTEQILAIDRFIHWHERQVMLGKELRAMLIKQSDAKGAAAS